MVLNPLPKIATAIWEQEEIVKIRQQFAELDPKVQSATILGGMGASLIALLLFLFIVVRAGLSAKQETEELRSSIQYLTQSSEQMDDLRQKIRAQSSSHDELELSASTPLSTVVEKVSGKSAIGKGSLELPADAPTGPSLDIKLNKISLRQLVRFLFYIESSKTQIQFQNLLVEKRGDPEGYLWASLKLSRAPAAPAAAASSALSAPSAPATSNGAKK